ncbi:hypothetical protein SeMB42_g05415 [Synchytrium endobioticum]|uniref:Uncharacterized protein n=1 Tax=Synchytrium endobioticum TaxID=286115 RepID=A0A507CNS7_9FUNG|nr:hypothetical protein SeLEV6574_g06413 [Synchytrium endobioticum]TPX40792.1 hypothetical protein SeLEV6574_g06407 [Synchytrium endobioticum]TPX41782.1 hypothetical protein SeMB42_g05415 [Synchytrium endobioticum]
MLPKIVIAVLAASSAALVSANEKAAHNHEKYAPEMFKDGAYKTEILTKEDHYVSEKGPIVVMERADHYPEVVYREDFVEVPYTLKGPKYEGHIKFPSEYAKYETKSDGPHLPEMKPRQIFSPIYEKQFVCPKYEKIVVVKVPAKCVCEPIEVKPKIVKAPEFKELPHEYKEDVYAKEVMHGKDAHYGGKGY